MAQVIHVDVYRLGAGNKFSAPTPRGIPMPAEFLPVPVNAQPDPKVFVYSKIRYTLGGMPIQDDVYCAESVQSLVTKANA